jgi:hypothetical protein
VEGAALGPCLRVRRVWAFANKAAGARRLGASLLGAARRGGLPRLAARLLDETGPLLPGGHAEREYQRAKLLRSAAGQGVAASAVLWPLVRPFLPGWGGEAPAPGRLPAVAELTARAAIKLAKWLEEEPSSWEPLAAMLSAGDASAPAAPGSAAAARVVRALELPLSRSLTTQADRLSAPAAPSFEQRVAQLSPRLSCGEWPS